MGIIDFINNAAAANRAANTPAALQSQTAPQNEIIIGEITGALSATHYYGHVIPGIGYVPYNLIFGQNLILGEYLDQPATLALARLMNKYSQDLDLFKSYLSKARIMTNGFPPLPKKIALKLDYMAIKGVSLSPYKADEAIVRSIRKVNFAGENTLALRDNIEDLFSGYAALNLIALDDKSSLPNVIVSQDMSSAVLDMLKKTELADKVIT